MKPDFFVIGAFKAGTSSMQHYLGQHPDIFMSPLKEPNYMAYAEKVSSDSTRDPNFPIRTRQSYEALFDSATQEQLKGEISPYYLHSPIAPQRIHEFAPNAKLIASLRNPVMRAYSNYLMQYRAGKTSLPPGDAFDQGGFWRDSSLYYDALNRYLSKFPRNQIKIILYEEFSENTMTVMKDIFCWLGLSELSSLDTRYIHNPGGIPKIPFIHKLSERARSHSYVQMYVPLSVRKFLAKFRDANLTDAPGLTREEIHRWQQFYRKDVERTSDLIGMDLSYWLEID